MEAVILGAGLGHGHEVVEHVEGRLGAAKDQVERVAAARQVPLRHSNPRLGTLRCKADELHACVSQARLHLPLAIRVGQKRQARAL